MDKCNDCDIKEFKDTKYRPMCCCGCELNYHWLKLLHELSEIKLFKIFKKKEINITMTEELKSCPLCGAEVETVGGNENWKPTYYDPDSGGDPYNIQCTKCGCSGGYHYGYLDAVKEWNKRVC